MSGACKCSERQESLAVKGHNRPARLWRVVQRLCHHSAYGGYRRVSSRYSGVVCLRCGAKWRTAASYVSKLVDVTIAECQIKVWYKGHREAMKSFGREVT